MLFNPGDQVIILPLQNAQCRNHMGTVITALDPTTNMHQVRWVANCNCCCDLKFGDFFETELAPC